jgi:hypothetical protein
LLPDVLVGRNLKAGVRWCCTLNIYRVLMKETKQKLTFCVHSEGSGNEEDKKETVFMDIHFENPAIVRYRTDTSYSWLDLLGKISDRYIVQLAGSSR